ncbi:MAG: hypothetical protein KJO44_09690 [Gemmatimonadetes bacterium]|nr:hypothetical protein [Gemmatimonadota bacterium]
MRIPSSVIVLLLMLPGCTTVHQEFPNIPSDQVWSAMIAVAETPSYDGADPTGRWTVRENHVWVDADNARVEIYRELHRMLRRARTQPIEQRRTWKFQVMLDGGPPPHGVFVSRGWGVPAHARREGERYWNDVRRLLGAGRMPEDAGRDAFIEPAATQPEGFAPEPRPVDEPKAPDAEPDLIDIDDLMPGG